MPARASRPSLSIPIWFLGVLLPGCTSTELKAPPAVAVSTTAAAHGGPSRSAVPTPLSLELIDDFNPPRRLPDEASAQDSARWDGAFRGLSGLYYDRQSATLFAVSDLSRAFPPRFYAFDVELGERSLRVTPRALHAFREGTPSGLLEDFDAESITGDGHGGFYVGTENSFDRPTQTVPRILHVRADGLFTGALQLPDAYLPAVEPAPRGTRSNLAFEGLAISPSGRWLTAIVESPLYQDGAEPSFEHGASVRLLRWDLTAGTEPVEYAYPVEPMPRPSRGTPAGGNNGVSELVSLDDPRLLVLERAYVPLVEGRGRNTIRIFEAMLPDAGAAPGAPPPLLSKHLILDLDDIVPQLEPDQQSLDNMEGMTLGPDLPSGEPTLLLVSDDNISSEQRTLFLAFRLEHLAPSARHQLRRSP